MERPAGGQACHGRKPCENPAKADYGQGVFFVEAQRAQGTQRLNFGFPEDFVALLALSNILTLYFNRVEIKVT